MSTTQSLVKKRKGALCAVSPKEPPRPARLPAAPMLDLGGKLAYNVREAAEKMGVSTWYIRDEIKRGALSYCASRGRILIPAWELIRYLTENMQPHTKSNPNRLT